MLREIDAARANNTASHMMSNSALTVQQMPQKVHVLTEMDAARQGDTDRRTTGIDTSKKTLPQIDTYA